MKHLKLAKLTIASLLVSASVYIAPSVQAETKVTTAEDINWGYLNAARGDKSPGAADLWGDRTKDTATGMLVRFNKGIEGSITSSGDEFKAVVIQGSLSYIDENKSNARTLNAGSYVASSTPAKHRLRNISDDETIVYVRASSKYQVNDLVSR